MTSIPANVRVIRQVDTPPAWMPVEQRYEWAVAGASEGRSLIGATSPDGGIVYWTTDTATHPDFPNILIASTTQSLPE